MDANTILIELAKSSRTDLGRKDFADQEGPQKVFTAVEESRGAVFMDGFVLYFRNMAGETAAFAPEAYRQIGAEENARVFEEACRTLTPGEFPTKKFERERLVDALDQAGQDRLDALDQRLYALREPVEELLLTFVREHPGVFGPVE